MLKQIEIVFKPGDPVQHVFVNDSEVTEAIRQPEITNAVSTAAAYPALESELAARQRDIASQQHCDGRRDIGTAVLPNVQVKIFDCQR